MRFTASHVPAAVAQDPSVHGSDGRARRDQRAGHTLQPTALVNRAYLSRPIDAGDLEVAHPLNRQVLGLRRRLPDESDEDLRRSLNDPGTVGQLQRRLQGRLQEAGRMIAEVVRMIRRPHPDGHVAPG